MMEFIHLNDTEIREDHGEDFGEGYCISSGGSQTCDEDSGGEGAHGKFGHQCSKIQCRDMLRYRMDPNGSFDCYESLFLGIIVSLCHLNIQELPETVTLKSCK